MNTFRLRFVCTANLCRSPLAERIAVLRVPPPARTSGWFAVASAGTHARNGMRMHPHAARRLTAMGAVPDGFRSRRLTPDMVADDDLVLTADLAQRDAVVALCPAASRRTFMIGEFVRLLEHREVPQDRTASGPVDDSPTGAAALPAETARDIVARAARFRGRVPWRDPALDQITDPDSEAAIASCAEQIDRALTRIIPVLTGVVPRRSPYPRT